MPTINTKAALKRPSTLPTSSSSRKLPRVRVYQNDQLADFKEIDKITKFDVITQNQASANYLFHETLECIVYYNLVKYSVLKKLFKIACKVGVVLTWCAMDGFF